MAKIRKQHTPEFKLKVVLEVLKGEKTANQLAGEFGVHPQVLSEWKNRFLADSTQVFARPKKATTAKAEAKEKALQKECEVVLCPTPEASDLI